MCGARLRDHVLTKHQSKRSTTPDSVAEHHVLDTVSSLHFVMRARSNDGCDTEDRTECDADTADSQILDETKGACKRFRKEHAAGAPSDERSVPRRGESTVAVLTSLPSFVMSLCHLGPNFFFGRG